MTFNTGKPIGSTDARDLSDNAENFDKALNSTAETWNDRLGVTRDTFEGALSKLSFYRAGTFAAGYTLTNMRQTLEYSGHEYSWAGTFPKVVAAGATPETSGGIAAGAWVDRTDLMLRNELALKDGEKLVGMCEDLTSLRATEPTFDGQTIKLKQHTAGTFKGGGVFRALLAGGAYTDNNGTVIKTSGSAVWLRVNADIINPLMFGAAGDGVSDDAAALNACFSNSLGQNVDLLGLTYNVASTVSFRGNKKREFKNGSIVTSSPITICRAYDFGHKLDNITINGNNVDGTRGLNVDLSAAGFSFSNGEIKNTGESAILLNASNSHIYRNKLTNCGNGASASGNFRATIYASEVERAHLQDNIATACRWGFYIRTDLLNPKTYGNKVTGNLIRGNNLLAESDSQGLSFQNHNGLIVQNNRVSDFGNNGIDMQYCDNSSVEFNTVVSCYAGVFIGDRSCQGHKITHNSIDSCITGIQYYNTPSYPSMIFKGITISDNYIKNCTQYSIFVSLTEVSSVNFMNTIDNNHIEGSYGAYISGLSIGSICGNKIYRATKEGIYAYNVQHTHISKNIINDVSYGASGSFDAIKLDGASSRNLVQDNYLYGTTKYGIYIVGGGVNNVVTGNRGRSLTTGILGDAGTGTITTVTNSTI